MQRLAELELMPMSQPDSAHFVVGEFPKWEMITTRRIGRATFETPDLGRERRTERQIDYYTNIFEPTFTAREKDQAFLSPRLDQQVVVLEKGAQARCAKIAFENVKGGRRKN
jgi:hypothetical protein